MRQTRRLTQITSGVRLKFESFMDMNDNKNKIIIITLTLLILASAIFSAARFAPALYGLFTAGEGRLAYGFISFFTVSKKSLSALGLFYFTAAWFLFSNNLARAFAMTAYTALAQLSFFAVCFMTFGFFCGPGDAMPQLILAALIIALVSLPQFRRAFASDAPIFKKHYKLSLTAFLCVIAAHCLCVAYFALNYPHLFAAPAGPYDFSSSAQAAPQPSFVAGAPLYDTAEVFGFKLALPAGFKLIKKIGEAASKQNGAYGKAVFASGSDQIMLTTKNGILIEQLFSMTAVFEIQSSYDFYTNYINDRFGAVWLYSKSYPRYDYASFTAGRWRGYMESGPVLSGGGYFAKSLNIWSAAPSNPARLEITFIFKNGGPPDALIKGILASLEGGDWPF